MQKLSLEKLKEMARDSRHKMPHVQAMRDQCEADRNNECNKLIGLQENMKDNMMDNLMKGKNENQSRMLL